MQGVGSAINKLNDIVAMIAEVRSISNSLASAEKRAANEEQRLKLWFWRPYNHTESLNFVLVVES